MLKILIGGYKFTNSINFGFKLENVDLTGSGFDINPTAGTATAGSDYTDFTGTTISVASGDTTGTKTVVVTNDTLFENTENVTATISNPSNILVNIITASATASITDNDNGAGSINADLSVTTNGDETGAVGFVYTVTLAKVNNTSAPITFSVNRTGGTAAAGSLT